MFLRNKVILKRVGMMPDHTDSSCDVKEKLRAAFLSHRSQPHWQMLGDPSECVQQILFSEYLLAKSQLGCSPPQMLGAMNAYVKKYQLAPMKTFNALARVIVNHSDKSPSKRRMIESPKPFKVKKGLAHRTPDLLQTS